jgi:periplasmic divalent cation tolerance protein
VHEFIQITVSCGSLEEAAAIGRALVERRLAGCVQVAGPVRSVYRWQGAVEEADEWICVIKTSAERFTDVASAVRELHSYECPEIIATAIAEGSEQYLAWLAEQTG